jgi:hypothetical protein
VITAEQQQKKLLPDLFEMLSPGNKATCVWISGDFGSGKSHLLKMLSYVLENKEEYEGRKFADIFSDKAGDDFELKGNIQRACRIPTESVLFNIQEKLDGISKGSIDPVLNIFLKEFNSKMGFDDKKPEIAEIERYFDNMGKYDTLKAEFKARFNEEWVDARKTILLKQQRLAEIMADVEGISKEEAMQNIKAQISNYKLDTEGFVELVKEHLDKHPGTRFIFFVDEVGQFIGKDVHRMLSLQTIAEGLLDKTDGRATIMVTSQMDIDATLGSLEKQQEYDFSRIQGRFTTRVNLTSANADEVIQRRLLEKRPEPQRQLCEVYEKQKNILKSLLNFGDKSQFKSAYKDAAQFAIDFPFMDYQFDLLQRAIIELSKNNAFSGKQQSVGERSLLTITQQVAIAYMEKDTDRIVRFSDMYEGLRGILQTKIQSDIQQAERTLNDDLALDVLKALFLVKYVKGFPSTTDNIAKLMLPTLDTDFPVYKSEIQEALNKLVRKSYIEKGADEEYHFQTNEEKDIETEIKNEVLAPDAINTELKRIFSGEIFSEQKIRLTSNKIFNFSRMVDDQQDGRDADIYIHFVTPLTTANVQDTQQMSQYSLSHSNQLCVFLGEDKYLAEDLAMFKKADKCLTRLLSEKGDAYRQQIVSDKRRVNANRRKNIVDRLTELTKSARLFMNAQELTDIKTTDLKARLTEGMTRLVDLVFIHLKMLTIEYDVDMLKRMINDTSKTGYEMDNCCLEIYNKIQRDKKLSIRSKVKDMVDYFKGNQYGWYEAATLCILGKLYKLEKISFRKDGSLIADRDLYTALTNAMQQANVIVDMEEAITPNQISKLKGYYKELFDDESCLAQSAKDVHAAFLERLNREIDAIQLVRHSHDQVFVRPLDEVIETLNRLRVVYPSLYSKSKEIEAAIEDKLDIADEICGFVRGNQFTIFEKVEHIKKGNQANLAYVAQGLTDKLNEIYTSKTPWKLMTDAKEVLEAIQKEISEKQEAARAEVLNAIEAKQQALTTHPAYSSIPGYMQEQFSAQWASITKRANEERYIGNLKAMTAEVDGIYNNAIDKINRWVEEEERKRKEAEEKAKKTGEGGGSTPPAKKVHKVVNKQKAMNVPFSKPRLETKEDVNQYIEALRKQLEGYIDQDNYIMLN